MSLIERALRDLVAEEVRRVVREERTALSPRLRLAIKWRQAPRDRPEAPS